MRGRPTTAETRKTPRRAAKQARSGQTIDFILDATEQVLAKVGIEAITTAMIAERAGVAKGAMFRYFPSKAAVLAAWEERAVQRDTATIAQLMETLVLTNPPLHEAIASVARETVTIVARYASYYPGATVGDVLKHSPARFTEKKKFVDFASKLTASALERAVDKHLLIPTDLELAGRLALDMLVLLTISWCTQRRSQDDERYAEEIVNAVVRYFMGAIKA